MSTTLLHQHLRWLAWDRDVTRLAIESLAAVPADQRGTDLYRRACSVAGHLLAARQIWLFRLGAWPSKPEGLFPASVELGKLASDYDETLSAWRTYTESLGDDAALERAIDYHSMDGSPFRSTIAEILAQLHTHGAYHRGQIAMLVKQSGGTPAMTDFIFWSRANL
jgi:uncharacterized damage-inducible protein DinB